MVGHPLLQTMLLEACSEQGECDMATPQTYTVDENNSCCVVDEIECSPPLQCSSDDENNEICKF